jgi:hypothetical protein
MGNTDWGDVISGGIGAAGAIYGQGQADDARAEAASEYQQDALGLAQLEQDWNRDNMAWSRDQNREIANENLARSIGGLSYNRPDQISDFGSTRWEQDDQGNITQRNEIAPELQEALGVLRGNYSEGVGNLDMGDFGVNNDVMNSIRGLQEPGLADTENAQRARYAAMGIPIQSTAMDRGERTLSDNRSRADLQAIGAGNTAWQQGQGNLRSNLGTMADLGTTWQQNAIAAPGFNQMGIPLQGEVGNVSAPGLGNIAGGANTAGNVAGQVTGDAWASGGTAAGNMANTIWKGI